MALSVTQSTGGVNSSVSAGNSTAPPANTMLCDSGAMAGLTNQVKSYKVVVNTYQSGTADANGSNMFVNVGGTNTAGVISAGTTLGPLLTTTQFSPQTFRVGVLAGQHIYVCTGNSAGGAGAIYNASMTVTELPMLTAVP